ncbi:MAG TPA: ferritin-like domain-containing protein [Chloroflexota bacterium]|nr:ferritin-like domain-containing protein [Chloroflexota bacterium]
MERTSSRPTIPRRRLLAAGAAGLGLATVGALPHATRAAAPRAACAEGVQEIIDTALVAEQLATTFYYTGLTTHAVMADPRTAGAGGDPNAVGPDGNRVNVAYLQAALDQEQKHARILAGAGAASPYTHFYFPATTFESLGFTNRTGTYLWVLDHLETAFIGAYLTAAQRFGALERVDLAVVALRILAVECQHRALYRVISEDDPADNVTVEVADFSCVADAAGVLKPFLTGQGFPGRAGPAVPLPTAAQTARAIGLNTSS